MQKHKTHKKRLIATALFILAVGFHSHALAQKFSENEVKAAFIYKLTKFIKWGSDSLTFCTIGDDDSNSHKIGQAVGKIAENIKIISDIGLDQINSCNMLLIDDSKSNNLKNIFVQTSRKQIVTISDIKSFTRKGGMFGFISDSDGRIKLELNLYNAKESNIDVSSRLLEMIKVVEK